MSEENLPDAGSFQPATTESGAVMSTPETLGKTQVPCRRSIDFGDIGWIGSFVFHQN
jgi:hypothetical protein